MTVDQAQRRKAVARWHRRIAIFVGAWLVALAASGLLINHANDWGLDRSPLPASLQSWLYGIEQGEDFCASAAVIGPACSAVFAELALPEGRLLISPNALYLLDHEAALIEALSASQFGLGRVEAGYADEAAIYLRSTEITIRADFDLLDWRAQEPPEAALLNGGAWQAAGEQSLVSWERLLLDLHAARFLGPLAKGFTDLMGALILLLALSGLWMYLLKSPRNGNGSGR